MKRHLITCASRGIMLPPEEIADAVAYALSRPAGVALENIDLSNLTGKL